MISIDNLAISFGKLKGKIICIIGPNGSGKTTLIKCLLGMTIPNTGKIVFDGKTIAGDEHYRKEIGYMPQIGRYPDNMTIGQIIAMMKDLRNDATNLDEEIFEQFQIQTMLSKKMRTLSGGTTQKVSAGLAFLFNPKVLVLDEPTAGLDPSAAEILKEKILKAKTAGKLVLITSHIMSEIDEMADEILYMQEGNILFHETVEQLKTETGETKLGRAILKTINPTAAA
jgi:Cu-processing system ATP-binding protein